jgi:hypothetical protein
MSSKPEGVAGRPRSAGLPRYRHGDTREPKIRAPMPGDFRNGSLARRTTARPVGSRRVSRSPSVPGQGDQPREFALTCAEPLTSPFTLGDVVACMLS